MNIKRDLDRIHTKYSWIENTLSRVNQMEQEKGKNMKKKVNRTSIRVLAAAAIITVLSVGSVFGYNYVQRTKIITMNQLIQRSHWITFQKLQTTELR